MLENALQYAQDAENLAQYVSPQLQQNLSQIVSQIQEQYNAVEEQIQKAQSNFAFNVFEGFANTFNTGLNNSMKDINVIMSKTCPTIGIEEMAINTAPSTSPARISVKMF